MSQKPFSSRRALGLASLTVGVFLFLISGVSAHAANYVVNQPDSTGSLSTPGYTYCSGSYGNPYGCAFTALATSTIARMRFMADIPTGDFGALDIYDLTQGTWIWNPYFPGWSHGVTDGTGSMTEYDFEPSAAESITMNSVNAGDTLGIGFFALSWPYSGSCYYGYACYESGSFGFDAGGNIPFFQASDSAGGYPFPSPPNTSFYSQISDADDGIATMYATEGTGTPLKTFPNDWILQVSSTTDATGNPLIADGYQWYQVTDPTDGTRGWMEAGDASGTVKYLPYASASQTAFAATSSTLINSESDRASTVIDAVSNYYNNTSTSSSLYSSDDGSNNLSEIFSTSSTAYPLDLVYAIAATEDGTDSHDLDNERVSGDYGHGIMQITTEPESSDVYYLQVALNSDPDTAIDVPAGTTDSPGHEAGHFDPATKAAVESFQSKYSSETLTPLGLTSPTGNVGYYTIQQLNSLLPISGIPSYFHFNKPLSISFNEDDITSLADEPANLGLASDLSIPPCGNLTDQSSDEYMGNCYAIATDSEDVYATSTTGQLFKFYSNTAQSIFANIKDGLTVLRQKYDDCVADEYGCYPTNTTTTVGDETYTYNDKLNILTTWGYNGFATSTYLGDVATTLSNINNYFPTISDPSTGVGSLVDKLNNIQGYEVQFSTLSPVDVSVTDDQGRTTGVVDGKVEAQIPDSEYNPSTKSGVILFPDNDQGLTFHVKGLKTGTYGLYVTSGKNLPDISFGGIGIPISQGAVNEFTISPQSSSTSTRSIMVKVDSRGTGFFDKLLLTDQNLSGIAAIIASSTISETTDTTSTQNEIATSTTATTTADITTASDVNMASSSLPIPTSSIENVSSSTKEYESDAISSEIQT